MGMRELDFVVVGAAAGCHLREEMNQKENTKPALCRGVHDLLSELLAKGLASHCNFKTNFHFSW